MTQTRTSPYVYVTWIPRYLTGDKSCLFAAWFKANHQDYAKMPSDFNSAKWLMDHTDLMNELVEELEERGHVNMCVNVIRRQPSLVSVQRRFRPCRRHPGRRPSSVPAPSASGTCSPPPAASSRSQLSPCPPS